MQDEKNCDPVTIPSRFSYSMKTETGPLHISMSDTIQNEPYSNNSEMLPRLEATNNDLETSKPSKPIKPTETAKATTITTVDSTKGYFRLMRSLKTSPSHRTLFENGETYGEICMRHLSQTHEDKRKRS